MLTEINKIIIAEPSLTVTNNFEPNNIMNQLILFVFDM